MEKIFHKIIKYRKLVLVLSFFFFCISAFLTFHFFKELKSELEFLLPVNSKAVLETKSSRERFPQSDMLLVFIKGKKIENVEKAYNFYLSKLKNDHFKYVSYVKSDVKEEVKFFKSHSLNFIPLDSWNQLYDKVSNQKREHVKSGEERVIGIFRGLKNKVLKLMSLNKMGFFAGLMSLPDGEFKSHDGHVRMIAIFHSRPMTNLKTAIEMDQYLTDIEKSIFQNFGEGLEIRRSGVANTLVQEYRLLWNDIVESIIYTVILVSGVVFFFFRSWKILITLFYTLFIGTLMGFGISSFFFDHLNSNSGFLSSILIGNSINTGIVIFSVVLAEMKKRNGLTYEEVVINALKRTYRPTFIAMMTSVVVFLCLTVNDFRAYFDFGVIGAITMFICWLCFYLFLPAIAVSPSLQLSDDYVKRIKFPFVGSLKFLFEKLFQYKKMLRLLYAFFVVSSLLFIIYKGLYKIDNVFEKDFSKLKDASYSTRSLDSFSKELAAVKFKRDLIPSMIMLTEDDQQALLLKNIIVSDPKVRGWTPEIKGFTYWDLFPSHQDEKAKVFDQLKKTNLSEKIYLPSVGKNDEKFIEELMKTSIYPEIKKNEAPEFLTFLFTEKNKRIGRIIYLNFNLNKLERDLFKLQDFYQHLRMISDQAVGSDRYIMTGIIPMLAEMGQMIFHYAWRSILLGFVLVLLLLVYFYYKEKKLALVLSIFTLTMLNYFIIFILLGWKLNILSLISIVVTFGIGVDYLANVLEDYHPGITTKTNLLQILPSTAPYIVLVSLTTVLGYIAVILATTQMAIISFSWFCLLGEFVALLGAFVLFVLLIPSHSLKN